MWPFRRSSPNRAEKQFIGAVVHDVGSICSECFQPPAFVLGERSVDLSEHRHEIETLATEVFSRLAKAPQSARPSLLGTMRETLEAELDSTPIESACAFIVSETVVKLEYILPFHTTKYPADQALFGMFSNLMLGFYAGTRPLFMDGLPAPAQAIAPEFARLFAMFAKRS